MYPETRAMDDPYDIHSRGFSDHSAVIAEVALSRKSIDSGIGAAQGQASICGGSLLDARLRSWPHVYCDQEKKMISEASFSIILRVLACVICFSQRPYCQRCTRLDLSALKEFVLFRNDDVSTNSLRNDAALLK